MNINPISSLAAVATALLIAATATATESMSKPETTAATQTASASAPSTAKPALVKGMTAEQVEQIAGKPAEIKPIDSPQGKAETWTYRRVVDRQTRQVAATVAAVDTFRGGTGVMGSTPMLEYRLESTTIYQVTALLMFDGKLVLAKQWRE